MASHLPRVRKICLALPQATEVESWGAPTFRVGKIFAMYAAANNHHGDGREGLWVKSDHFTQDLLVRGMPARYFVPAYVGPSGWTGVYLDGRTDWTALTDLLRDAYRMTASKKLAALLTDDAPGAVRKSPAKSAIKQRAKNKPVAQSRPTTAKKTPKVAKKQAAKKQAAKKTRPR